MAGLVDVPSTAKAVKEFAESIGVKISAIGFAFLIVVVGGLYIYYYALTKAVEPLAALTDRVAALEIKGNELDASISARFAEQRRLSDALDESIRRSASEFDKLTQRLEGIEDGYWVRPTISSVNEDPLRSSVVLPISRDDDVLMQVFLPERYKEFGPDGAYVQGITLVVNGAPVELAAYIKEFPDVLPKEIFNPRQPSQEFVLYFDKAVITTDPDIVDSIGMLFIVKRTMILQAASDEAASFTD